MHPVINAALGGLAGLSCGLTLWQWGVARRFPLHQRLPSPGGPGAQPAVTLLKPLKGCDAATAACLRSWFTQNYSGPVQIIFAVAAESDPVCPIVQRLLQEFPAADAQLILCGPPAGANSKVSKLAQVEPLAKHDLLVVSDADVEVPPDFLAQLVLPLADPKVGLVNCFYCLANPSTLALHWEAIAINADFWSSVLQARSLKPLDFALGAVMATRRAQLAQIGGFTALRECLADDYQLGHRIAAHGHRLELSPVVVECWSGPMDWQHVWKHQLRWARTIRVCQPAAYFFSILSNATLWPLLWVALNPTRGVLTAAAAFWILRVLAALDLQRQLTRSWSHLASGWLTPVKDLLQAALWLLAFLGNTVEWRGTRMRLRRDGTLVKIEQKQTKETKT
jgi:ceramide glucosyltransferase